LVVESFSEDEDEDKTTDKEGKVEAVSSVSSSELDSGAALAPVEIQDLLHRKEELEKRHRKQERHRQRVQVRIMPLFRTCHVVTSHISV
jgi:protein SMG6